MHYEVKEELDNDEEDKRGPEAFVKLRLNLLNMSNQVFL